MNKAVHGFGERLRKPEGSLIAHEKGRTFLADEKIDAHAILTERLAQKGEEALLSHHALFQHLAHGDCRGVADDENEMGIYQETGDLRQIQDADRVFPSPDVER